MNEISTKTINEVLGKISKEILINKDKINNNLNLGLNKILEKSEYNSTTTFKDDSKAISYYMYLNDELTEHTITLTAKDNLLEKIEINLDKDSIILNFTEQNKILDFNKGSLKDILFSD